MEGFPTYHSKEDAIRAAVSYIDRRTGLKTGDFARIRPSVPKYFVVEFMRRATEGGYHRCLEMTYERRTDGTTSKTEIFKLVKIRKC